VAGIAHLGGDGLESFQLFWRAVTGGKSGEGYLEVQACLDEVFEVLALKKDSPFDDAGKEVGGAACEVGAVALSLFEQTDEDEGLDCLAEGRPSYPESIAQRALAGKALSRLNRAGGQVVDELPGDLNGRRFARGDRGIR
jgi:hypothetical protein